MGNKVEEKQSIQLQGMRSRFTFDLCLQGRLLILSAYPDVGHPSELTREKCMMMNAWCEQIAELRL